MRDQCSPCWLTTARDRELIQMQHFCHNGDTICHPNSSYVNVDATIMRCIFTFPTVDVCRERRADSVQAFVVHAKVARCQRCWINYFSCLKFRFCLTTVSNIMIIVNWCSGVACNWCVWLDNGLILALIVMSLCYFVGLDTQATKKLDISLDSDRYVHLHHISEHSTLIMLTKAFLSVVYNYKCHCCTTGNRIIRQETIGYSSAFPLWIGIFTEFSLWICCCASIFMVSRNA